MPTGSEAKEQCDRSSQFFRRHWSCILSASRVTSGPRLIYTGGELECRASATDARGRDELRGLRAVGGGRIAALENGAPDKRL